MLFFIMKQYSDKDLMIIERKRAEKKLPHPGECIQYMWFSILSAKEYFESAKLQFNQKKPPLAIDSFIRGLEELSKIGIIELLFPWENPEKVKEYKKTQKDHISKLKNLLDCFKKIFVNENDYLKIDYKVIMSILKGKGVFKTNNFLFKIFSKLADNNKYELFDASTVAKKFHKLRLEVAYIDFDNKTAKSPCHSLSKEHIKSFELLTSVFLKVLEGLICLGNESVPFYSKLLRKCYYSQNKNEINYLKKEINRQTKRTLPAIRFCIDNLCKEKTGKSLDELTEDDKKRIKTDKINKEEIGKIWKEIVELIVGSQEIEDIYFYPPLKKEAKKYYSQFTQI